MPANASSSPKVYIRDGGIAHALLGIRHNALAGHPVVGASWEGFVIENLIVQPRPHGPSFIAPQRARNRLVLEVPGQGLWAINIKRGLSARPERGFHSARADLSPAKSFLVNSGNDRYAIAKGVEAIGLKDMVTTLSTL